MTPEQLTQFLTSLANTLNLYVRDQWPRTARDESLRFIDNNFRTQGYNGASFQPWKKNSTNTTILVKSGDLRRGNHGDALPYEAYMYNNVAYAKAHNEGFVGRVKVKAHSRSHYREEQIGTGRYTKSGKERTKKVHVLDRTTDVKEYYRQMNITKRQFMPITPDDAPSLLNDIASQTEKDLIQILKKA